MKHDPAPGWWLTVFVVFVFVSYSAIRLLGLQTVPPQASQAVITSPSGNVQIYKWQAWEQMPVTTSPLWVGQQQMSVPKMRDMPSRVTLAADLNETVPICVETENGSECVPLSSVRQFIVAKKTK